MPAIPLFAWRVDLFFQVLAAADNGELAAIPGIGPQILAVGALPTDWARMIKGTAYLILYNLVEAFTRRGFQAVFDAIKNDGLCGTDLTDLVQMSFGTFAFRMASITQRHQPPRWARR